ncbi:MAG: ApaG domain, partial [Chitinophagaceae bacterium]
MVTAISQGVKVSIDTVYQQQYSNPVNEHFMFAYSILIENLTENTVQLLRRQWFIFDSNGSMREVEGEGVVGLQP